MGKGCGGSTHHFKTPTHHTRHVPLDTRTKAAGVVALLAFTLAFGVLAADLAWNVEAALETPGERLDLTERYISREPTVPNSTAVEMVLVVTNDRPIGYDADVRVVAGDRFVPHPPDRGEDMEDTDTREVLVDQRVDLAPGETVRIPFTVDTTEYARGSQVQGPRGEVGFLPLQVDVGSRTTQLFISIVEDDA